MLAGYAGAWRQDTQGKVLQREKSSIQGWFGLAPTVLPTLPSCLSQSPTKVETLLPATPGLAVGCSPHSVPPLGPRYSQP